MKQFKRIMAGLDFSHMDKTVIEQTASIARAGNIDKIYFTHIQRQLVLPELLVREFPQIAEPVDEKLSQQMKKNVGEYFPDHSRFDIQFEVIEGSPSKELIHRIEVKGVDLLIMGKKVNPDSSGVIPNQVARSCISSVLFVTEGAKLEYDKILVPIDFSPHSELALLHSFEIARSQKTPAEIIPFNAYSVPVPIIGFPYYPDPKISPLCKKSTEEEYHKFIKNLPTDGLLIRPIIREQTGAGAAKLAFNSAHKEHCDLIVVGSQGKSRLQRILIGSFAEKLLSVNKNKPILLVKPSPTISNYSFNQ